MKNYVIALKREGQVRLTVATEDQFLRAFPRATPRDYDNAKSLAALIVVDN